MLIVSHLSIAKICSTFLTNKNYIILHVGIYLYILDLKLEEMIELGRAFEQATGHRAKKGDGLASFRVRKDLKHSQRFAFRNILIGRMRKQELRVILAQPLLFFFVLFISNLIEFNFVGSACLP